MSKENIKKIISNPFTISFLVVSLVLVYVIFNIITQPNKFDKLLKFGNEINLINNKPAVEKVLTSNDFIDVCNKNISELEKIITNIENLKVSVELSKQKDILITSAKTNIDLYKNLAYFLDNASATNIFENNKNVLSKKSELDKNFLDAKNLKLNLVLDTKNNTILNKMFSYTNEIIKLNRSEQIQLSQNEAFKNSLNTIYSKFAPLNEDLFFVLDIVKKEKKDLSSVLDTINENIKTLNLLNVELHSLSVPNGSSDLFLSLQSVFECYDIYIHAMRDYLINEIAGTADKSTLNSAKDRYSETNAQIISYLKLFNESK